MLSDKLKRIALYYGTRSMAVLLEYLGDVGIV